MLHKCSVFSWVAICCAVCLVYDAGAAPAIKRLGMGTSYSGANATKTTNANPSRVSTIRQISGVKPVVATKTTTVDTKKTDSETEAPRLTIGKYIHTNGVKTGLIKPTTSAATVQAQSDEILNLTDRVVQLENQMENKQNALNPGDGIEIKNDVISVTDKLQELPDKIDNLSDQLDEKVDVANLSSNYYTKSEIENVINEQVENVVNNTVIQNGDTIYDSGSGERTYVSIVDEFNPNVLQ